MTRLGADAADVAIGARLRTQRRALGVTQLALAEHLGVTFQQVQKYEKGVNRMSATMLASAAKFLKTSLAALLGEDDESSVAEPILKNLHVGGATELLALYRELSPRRRRALLELARAMIED
ncbi:helix-turn-helix transcriptional regulator [Brevundimonas sp. 2R-24]|uniref:Helix-turn-helix transcriptional regulator n=1 Tax=Peiella sedimenti TaxID=3061083 RepID=A0ABT8SIB3_9CAUL|nr:helix-turn-helix transcriptional regulator [Caulobacteraceae bacterium XZ-24]